MRERGKRSELFASFEISVPAGVPEFKSPPRQLVNIERLEKQLSSRRNNEADELLDEVEYSEDLDREQALEYVNNLRAFADYMGVPENQKSDYISSISEEVSAGELKTASDEYGGISDAAEIAEKNLESPDSRLDRAIMDEMRDNISGMKNILEEPELPEYSEFEDGKHLVRGDRKKEWLVYEGEVIERENR